MMNIFRQKNSPCGSSSEGSYDLTRNVPVVKLKKQKTSQKTSPRKTWPGTSSGKDNRRAEGENTDDTKMEKLKKQKTQRTSKRKTVFSISSDEDNRGAESENCDYTKMGNVAVLKLLKKKDGSRIYNKPQYCLYCPVHCYKMARHLLQKHCHETAVKQAACFPLNSKERKFHFELIRNQGNRAHNNEVLKTGRGTLIPRRRAAKALKANDYTYCINCEALLKRNGLLSHMSRCKLSRKCREPKPEEVVVEAVDSDLSQTEANSSFCSSSPGSSRSKRRQSTPDEFCDDSAPIVIPQTSDGPETGPRRSKRGQRTSVTPGSFEPAATGSSRSKERQRPESDSGDPETGPSTPKRKQETVKQWRP
ncbi:uncharacterized protein LOC115572723 [Sparus aurata]|uniref:uncharacterized protein LOC115572723 n=1 Tax=Sparus aurata TaxID=8175 RepID=UPI0011C11880|nr:uncharacterized protein LOC115572723 [Sparus aurata]XP_030259004.1 uncharacterized protein LOC115572723 [Sparus aurata]XP_030259005.1 uncharacterized protein LOC115572723 [Sparus aurata]XP_030259007.1 uncharacterized protein LOC115572723 [Sparus aurata]